MNKKIIDRIKKENYVTSYFTQTSGYLSPDGYFVHLISKKDEDRGDWYRNDHRTIASFMNTTYKERCGGGDGTNAMYRIMQRHKFMRFSPEGHGFEFIGSITTSQARAIRDYVRDLRIIGDYSDIIIEKTSLKPFKIYVIASNYEDFLDYCYEHNILI